MTVVVWIVSILVAEQQDGGDIDRPHFVYIAASFGVESAGQSLEAAVNLIDPQIVVSEVIASAGAVLAVHIEMRAR